MLGQKNDLSSVISVMRDLPVHGLQHGMGFATESASWLSSDTERNLALESMNETARHAQKLAAMLPTNRDLLMRVRRYGLQKI